MNGLRRAITSTTFLWLPSDLSPTRLSSTPLNLSKLTESLNQSWDTSTLSGRTILANLELYSNASTLKGFTEGFVNLSILEIQQVYLASILAGVSDLTTTSWGSLCSKGVPGTSSTMDQALLQENLNISLVIWERTLNSLEDDDNTESSNLDPYAFDILQQSLVSKLGYFVFIPYFTVNWCYRYLV